MTDFLGNEVNIGDTVMVAVNSTLCPGIVMKRRNNDWLLVKRMKPNDAGLLNSIELVSSYYSYLSSASSYKVTQVLRVPESVLPEELATNFQRWKQILTINKYLK